MQHNDYGWLVLLWTIAHKYYDHLQNDLAMLEEEKLLLEEEKTLLEERVQELTLQLEKAQVHLITRFCCIP